MAVADGDDIGGIELLGGDVDGALRGRCLRPETFVGQLVGAGGDGVDDGVADADEERIVCGEDRGPELFEGCGRGWRHGGRRTELGEVEACGQIDDRRRVARLRRGVAFADFPGADADDGVVTHVGRGGAAEDVDGEGAFFERTRVTVEGVPADVLQELARPLAALERGAGADSLDCRHHLLGGVSASELGRGKL